MRQPGTLNYYLKYKKCRKTGCRVCREGKGHGPYWHGSYTDPQTKRTVEVYIGKHLPADAPALSHIGRPGQNPLVGRENEMRLLQDYLAPGNVSPRKRQMSLRKESSIPSVLVMTGEAGVGKTRLAEEAARMTFQQGWWIALGRASSYTRTLSTPNPYQVWTEILRQAIEMATKKSHTPPFAHPSLSFLCSLLPELQTLLPTEQQETSALSPEQSQLHLWEAVYTLLSTISDGQPFLIILDDIQWADDSSCALLAYLAKRIQGSTLFFLCTCREGEMLLDHPLRAILHDLEQEGHLTLLPLHPLAINHIHTLISTIHPLPDLLMQRIALRTAGNPFFAEELVRAFAVAPPAALALASISIPDEALHVHLPDSIAHALGSRLTRLSPACQQMLERATVLGDAFQFDTICALEHLINPHAGQAGENMLDLLDEAIQAGILSEEPHSTGILYHWWHPLLSQYLYERISMTQRIRYHQAIAKLMQQQAPDQREQEQRASAIFHHLILGKGPQSQGGELARYAELAGNYAYRLAVYPQAETYYTMALNYLREIPVSERGEEESAARPRREEKLLELLGECAWFQGKHAEAQHRYEEALVLAQHQQLLQESQAVQVQALLQCEVGFMWYNRGKLDQATRCYQQGEMILQAVGIDTGPAWAYLRYRQSYVLWRTGAYEEALVLAQQAWTLQEHAPRHPESIILSSPSTLIRRMLAGDPVHRGRIQQLLGLIFNGMGRYRDTINHWHAAHAIFAHYESKRDLAIVCCNLGDVHLRKAEYASAQEALQQALDLAEQMNEIAVIGVVLGNLGILALRQGALTEAESWLQRGVQRAEQAQNTIHSSMLHAYLAVALLEQGQIDAARSSVYQAVTLSRTLHIAPCLATALVSLAALRFAQAKQAKNQSALLNRTEHTLHHILRLSDIEQETRIEARLLFARVIASKGEQKQAQDLATQALQEATQYDLLWLAQRAQQMLSDELTIQENDNAMQKEKAQGSSFCETES